MSFIVFTFDLPTRRKDNKGWGKEMKTIQINGKNYAGIQPPEMTDAAFKSMVLRNNMTADVMAAFRLSVKKLKK